jgi:hypothetical protein
MYSLINSEFAQQSSEPPDGYLALRKRWLVAYEWVRLLALVFEHSTSIASVHIIHGCQGPSLYEKNGNGTGQI